MMNPSQSPHNSGGYPSSQFHRENQENDPAMMAPLVVGGGGARQRRIGGEAPYRDFPNGTAEAPVHLESFTPNIGAASPFGPNYDDDDGGNGKQKSKKDSTKQSIVSSCLQQCGCSKKQMEEEEGPNGMYYRDDFNDSAHTYSLGTSEENGIWMNTSDQAGTIMAVLVWFLLGYSAVTISFLASTGGIPTSLSMWYCLFCSLALASHAKTTLTDPGSVPASAVPTESQRKNDKLTMCSQCQTFKPPFSHHCRICNRCISRMDHHCPWMNNCIGVGNMKHFCLFLIYTWTCSTFSLILLGWNYFFCATEECMFNFALTQLVRIMTCLSIGSFLFTSSMLMNVAYGIMTGIGTIDRLKKKATNTVHQSDEESVRLIDIFGVAGFQTWPFPVDPVFEEYDIAMGYSTPQRLLREQMKENANHPHHAGTTSVGGSYVGAPSIVSSYIPV